MRENHHLPRLASGNRRPRIAASRIFGAPTTDEIKAKVKAQLTKNIAAFSHLIKCSPYIAGSEFSLADCAAAVHLPMVSNISLAMFGEDLLASLPIADYLELLESRPSVQKVRAESAANMPEFRAYLKSLR